MAANCPRVPFYLVNLIAAGQYADFTLLLPKNLAKFPSCMPYDVQLARLLRNDLAKIWNFRDWSKAWAVYTAVFSKKCPERISDLLAYYLLISKADKEGPGCNWMGYDCLLREKAASDRSLPRGLAELSLWVTHMLSKKALHNSTK